jgi:hypothetical protein
VKHSRFVIILCIQVHLRKAAISMGFAHLGNLSQMTCSIDKPARADTSHAGAVKPRTRILFCREAPEGAAQMIDHIDCRPYRGFRFKRATYSGASQPRQELCRPSGPKESYST